MQCVAISQTIVRKELTIDSLQVKNVYTGLKQGEACKIELKKSIDVIIQQNEIIHNLKSEIDTVLNKNKEINFKLDQETQKLITTEVKLSKAEKPPFYKRPGIWFVAGLVLSAIIFK